MAVRFVDYTAISNSMGLPVTPLSQPVLEPAIKAAHLRAQAILRTKFDRGTDTNTFLLDKTLTGGIVPNKMFRLGLKNGFVRQSPVPTVVHAETLDDILSNNGLVIPTSDYHLDYSLGILHVRESYENSYIRVGYDYGFIEDDTEETPPQELVEAITSLTISVVHSRTVNKEKPVLIKELEPGRIESAQANDLLGPLIRIKPFVLSPIY